jgi:signal transduction histidine kinase
LLDEEIVELKDEINEFIVSVTPTIPKNIKVLTDFDHAESFTVAIDPTKMYQVLLNLFTNAIQAIEDKEGTVVVELREHWHQNKLGYLIVIKDSGCGMDLTLQSKIFEPYFTTRYQKGGTGLGLALCQSIINGYKGHIEIDSALNQGSAFSIWLPKAS